jgi:hypothetical protein
MTQTLLQDAKVVILPGGAKCGSSALRVFLSNFEGEMEIPGNRRLVFFRLLVQGEKRRLKVLRSGDVGSSKLHKMKIAPASLQDLKSNFGNGCLHHLTAELVAKLSSDEVLVVSNEYWGQEL